MYCTYIGRSMDFNFAHSRRNACVTLLAISRARFVYEYVRELRSGDLSP